MPHPCIMANQLFALIACVWEQAVITGDAVGTVIWLDVLAAIKGLLAVVTVKTVSHCNILQAWNKERRNLGQQHKKTRNKSQQIQRDEDKNRKRRQYRKRRRGGRVLRNDSVTFSGIAIGQQCGFHCQYLCCKYFGLYQRWSWAQTKHTVQVGASGKRRRDRKGVRERARQERQRKMPINFYCCVMKVWWLQKEGTGECAVSETTKLLPVTVNRLKSATYIKAPIWTRQPQSWLSCV